MLVADATSAAPTASPLSIVDADLARDERQPDLWVKRAMILTQADAQQINRPAIIACLEKALTFAPDHLLALVCASITLLYLSPLLINNNHTVVRYDRKCVRNCL